MLSYEIQTKKTTIGHLRFMTFKGKIISKEGGFKVREKSHNLIQFNSKYHHDNEKPRVLTTQYSG